MIFAELLEKLRRHEDLTPDEATRAMGVIMDGEAQPAHIAGLLMALALKGERPPEMAGFARAMRARARPLPAGAAPLGDVFDTCGTGGDGAQTFNVSTAAAVVLAACGVRVAKHGNRAVSSRCGSADVFEALGVNLEASADRVVHALTTVGLAFFFAPAWHPSMKHAGPTRRELGVRTAFNLLGPLTNPAGALRQLVGVSRPEHTELMARTLGTLGAERAWVVHGADGLDELSSTGFTKVSEYRNGTVHTFYLHPIDVGLPLADKAALAGGTAIENAAMIEDLCAGATGPRRDIVCLNAGAALLIAGRVATVKEGIAMAGSALSEGRASATLVALREAYSA
ncbi:MAG: anthranilate phosphoribosyltransferase [Acidobacteria bacterium]|jgi:anthranilate phosphoribosyltransferase|nr:anthranilate phosphoribosyltransferase [Acidobacteriota bacterium]